MKLELSYSKKTGQRAWRQRFMIIPCKSCGKNTESKNKNYVLCETCMKQYLYDLEELARQNEKKLKYDNLKKNQYHSLYKKIERIKDRLSDMPRDVHAQEAHDRNCLKCDKSFVAVGKFNRICSRCRDLISTYEDSFI